MMRIYKLLCMLALALFVNVIGPSNFQAQAANPLEEPLLVSLRQIFFEFDRLRLETAHPKTQASNQQRAEIYSTYLIALQSYGLIPQDEDLCMFSLLPVIESRREANPLPVREPMERLLLEDPCYPQIGVPKYDNPAGWLLDPDFSAGGATNSDGYYRGSPHGSSPNARSGGNGGGVGRRGGGE